MKIPVRIMRRIWNGLTGPSKSLHSTSDRRQAQLLAALVIVLILIILSRRLRIMLGLEMPFFPTSDLILLLAIPVGAAYWLSRTRFFMIGAWLTILSLTLGVVFAAYFSAPTILVPYIYYLVWPILLSSLFLPPAVPGVLTVLSLGLILATPAIFGNNLSVSDLLIGPFGVIATMSVLGAILASFRNETEKDNRIQMAREIEEQTQELTLANNQLKNEVFERKQAEDALHRAQELLEQRIQERTAELAQERNLLRTVIDNLPDQVFALNSANRFILCNKSGAEALDEGDPEKVVGTLFEEHFGQDVIGQFLQENISVIQSGIPILSQEEPRIDGSGNTHWVHLTRVPLQSPQSGTTGVVCITRDITEKKKDEEILHQRDLLLEMVCRLAEMLVKTPTWETSVPESLDFMGRVTRCSRIYIYKNIIEADGNISFEQLESWTASEGERQVERPEKISWDTRRLSRWKQELSQQKVVYGLLKDFSPLERTLFEPQGVLSMLTIPIFVGDNWWGELNFEDCHTPRLWQPIEIEVLGLAANIFAAVIERHEAEQTLRESEARFRSVAKSAKDAIISIDSKAQIIFWNDGASEIFGYSSEEALNQKMGMLMPKAYNLMHAFELSKAIERGQLKNDRDIIEATGKRKNGSEFPAELSFASWKTSQGIFFTTIIRDITERKRQAEALQRAYNQNKHLLSSISSLLIGITPEGIITHWNDSAAELLNLSNSAVTGQNFFNLKIEWSLNLIVEAIQVCKETRKKARARDISYTRPNGNIAILGISVDPIIEEEQISGYLLQGADITQRKIMEQQLAQTHKLESIGQLAAGIAHEINTPAQFVTSNLSFLKEQWPILEGQLAPAPARDPAPAARPGALDKLEFILQEYPLAISQSLEGMERITRIVGAMRNFSHPSTEKKSVMNINRVLDNTITVSRHEWRQVATIVTDFDPNLPTVSGYPAELSQAFLNIIINAADAIGDVVIAGSNQPGTITISTRTLENGIEIRIADTGTGIPAQVQGRIFDYFFTTKDVSKGTGQGLSIAYNVIVKKHGGTIQFETAPNAGTTFIINIPFE